VHAESGSRGKLTYEELEHFPDDGKRHEIIDGFHVAEPSPTTYHQKVSGRLFLQLHAQVEHPGLGEVFCAPLDVHLSDHDVVEPDLVVVLKEARTIVTPTKIKGTPHLVVEILSPSTEERDRGLKKALYKCTGVAEYWIVDLDEHVVEQYVLADGEYELAGKHANTLTSRRIPNVRIDLRKVW
jgi:Uma2 family endonuclease